MPVGDLHPAPVETHRTDHRDTSNRRQAAYPSESLDYWWRAVEALADELQIHPTGAHQILMDAAGDVTKGMVWDRYL